MDTNLNPPLFPWEFFLLQSEGIKPDDFTWEAFLKFLDNLCLRPEIQSIFEERYHPSFFSPLVPHLVKSSNRYIPLCCSGSKRKPFISLDQFMEFLNRRQRDSRLNEVLYPPLKREQVRQIMEKYETNTSQLERGSFLFKSCFKFWKSKKNLPFKATPPSPSRPDQFAGLRSLPGGRGERHRAPGEAGRHRRHEPAAVSLLRQLLAQHVPHR